MLKTVATGGKGHFREELKFRQKRESICIVQGRVGLGDWTNISAIGDWLS